MAARGLGKENEIVTGEPDEGESKTRYKKRKRTR